MRVMPRSSHTTSSVRRPMRWSTIRSTRTAARATRCAHVQRSVKRRSFTITLRDASPPVPLSADQRSGEPHRNYLYTKPAGDTTGLHLLLWRVYVPDRGRDLRGGVPLPHPVWARERRVETGQRLCDTLTSQVRRLPDLSALLISKAQYDSLRYQPGVPVYFPAKPRPV